MFGLHDRAHNTVTLMLEYSHPSPMERVYAPVNVLPEDGSEDIACHIVWRIDVSKAKHATRPRSRVLQGYFFDGRWDTEVLLDQTSSGLPVPPSRPFALQITFMRNGYLSYIDGVLQGVTVPPYKLRPADGCTPVVQVR